MFVAKTKCQPKAITLARADGETDEKRRPRLNTGKGEEEEVALSDCFDLGVRSAAALFNAVNDSKIFSSLRCVCEVACTYSNGWSCAAFEKTASAARRRANVSAN
jgi:hypothetical protein